LESTSLSYPVERRRTAYAGILDPGLAAAADDGRTLGGYRFGRIAVGPEGFAFIASPAAYGPESRETFIIDPGGSPIPGAVVGAVRIAGEGKPRGEPARGYSDARGSYLLDGLEPGTYEIEVRSSGFAPLRAPEIEIGPDPREEDFTIEVRWLVRGQVVNGDGRDGRRLFTVSEEQLGVIAWDLTKPGK
jgi:hypothetical protein